jgi:hypothetical protein
MENFEYFDPRRAFGKAAGGKTPPGFFIVVQSRSGVTPEEIAAKVSPYVAQMHRGMRRDIMLTGCALLTDHSYLKLEDGSDIVIGPDACGMCSLLLW